MNNTNIGEHVSANCMKLTKDEKFIAAFLILYLTSYFIMITTKYTLWGSDILFLIRVSQNLDFHHFLSTQNGYPQGLPLLLREESLLGGLSIFTFAKIHIGILFIALTFFTFLISQKLFSNIKISLLASFIVGSVYPQATVMSPQYGQPVNLALILVFSSIVFLFLFERKNKYSYLFLAFLIILPLPLIHRSSTLIIGLILLVYSLIFMVNKKISIKKRVIFFIIFALSIILFVFINYMIYKHEISTFLAHIILSKEYLEINQPAAYSSGYFMNYVGWELIPFFAISLIYTKYFVKKLPLIFTAFFSIVIFIVLLYVVGFVLLGISVSWRAANYSLYIISILVSFTIFSIAKKSNKSNWMLWLLYIITSISLILYTLDLAIQKWIYRSVTGTSPERIKIHFIGGAYAPYLIYGGILLIIALMGILLFYSYKSTFKFNISKKLFSKKFMVLLLIIIFILPRILMGATGFYLIPPNITDAQYRAFEYINTHYPNASIFSDPKTVWFAVGYGLHMRYKVGNHIFEDMVYLYGPSPQGSIPTGWALTFDKWIKNRDVDSIYKFMKNSNNTLLIIDINNGMLLDMNVNPPHGEYVHMPDVLLSFKNAVDNSGKFHLIYSQNYEGKTYVYLIT